MDYTPVISGAVCLAIGLFISALRNKSAVKKAINNYLFSSLPHPTYGDGDILVKTEILYNYFKSKYASYSQQVA